MPPRTNLPRAHLELPRIGLLMAGDRSYPSYLAFEDGLQELGRVDGQTVEVQARFAEGQQERLPGLAAELIALRPDVLAVIGAVAFFAARELAADIPLVFAIVVDAVDAGIVDAAQRGHKVTGASSYDPLQARQQVQLLRQVVPGMSRLGILGDANVPKLLAEQSSSAADDAGLCSNVCLLSGRDDIIPAIASFRCAGAEALLVLEVPRTSAHGSVITELAHNARLPTMFGRDLARVGPMLAYGTSLAVAAQRMAWLVHCILDGASPEDLPIEHTTNAELIVNLGVARKLGLEIPSAILAQAIGIIE